LSHFEVFFRYQPVSPYELPLQLQPSGTPRQQRDQIYTSYFLQTLARKQDQASQQRYKACHDMHKQPLSFSPEDKVWFHMESQNFQSQHYHKLKPLRYGPYTILQKVDNNAYHLDFPP